MKFTLEIEIGELILTPQDIHEAIARCAWPRLDEHELVIDDGEITDKSGVVVGSFRVTDSVGTPQEASAALEALMREHDNFGAHDSEGMDAVYRIERAAENGKPFPLRGSNPFSLYTSRYGWEHVSAELIRAGERYWKALTADKLGITIA